MPYVSRAQRGWMHANKPEMAKKWDAHTPKGAKLPAHAKAGLKRASASSCKGK